MKNDFKEIILKELNKERIAKDGIFNYVKIKEMIENNQNDKLDFNYNILSLLAIQSWLKQFPWSM